MIDAAFASKQVVKISAHRESVWLKRKVITAVETVDNANDFRRPRRVSMSHPPIYEMEMLGTPLCFVRWESYIP